MTPPTPAPLPFFVYGTLRSGEGNHGVFLRGRIRSAEPARLAGAVLYDGPGYPYAVEEPGGVVRGELMTVLPEKYGEVLTSLDRLEGHVPGDPRSLYERVEREVVRESDGAAVRAWVYFAGPSVTARLRAAGRLIEGGDWTLRNRPSPAARPLPFPPPPPAPRTP
ncbi:MULTISPECIES: gamma-glutamylcyclotransferase family protein [Streptomyces]|uniref:Gamma-glutamylcyclotransferase n=1 Tax=Streptomyces thermogriseus TaxID=75292 RepID=A0ABN1SUU9_9ACTN|nr:MULTISPECIES: gamma-glutamylcyclotransferase family protein [Streptomyces]MDN5381183.1 gamma-glutamylcyclotransferase [Streptomyces sp. LB8]